MTKSSFLLGSLLFASLTVSAQAADTSMPGMGKMSGPHSMAGGKMMGRHVMSGTVDKVDHATGMVSLKTGAGDLMLHFPPPTIKDLNDGDAITVHLAYSKNSPKTK